MPNLGINFGVSMNRLKSRILNPSLTSIYSVVIPQPSFATSPSVDGELLELTCMEASLPGSSIATIETNRDYHGIIERHAYSRLYDETIDLTFLVTLDSNYLQIRFFDYWMKYIVGETGYNDSQLRNKIVQRAKYPDSYKSSMRIVKYEKSLGTGDELLSNVLDYEFVDVYPKAMNTIPVSYEASQLLKVTVSMNYTRYFITQNKGTTDTNYFAKSSPRFFNTALSPGNPELPFNAFDANLNIESFVNTDATFKNTNLNIDWNNLPQSNFNFNTSL